MTAKQPPTWAVEARQRLEDLARAELAKHVTAGAPFYAVYERDVEIIGADPRDADDHILDRLLAGDGIERMPPEEEAKILQLRLVAPLRFRMPGGASPRVAVAIVVVDNGLVPEVKSSVVVDLVTARMAGSAARR